MIIDKIIIVSEKIVPFLFLWPIIVPILILSSLILFNEGVDLIFHKNKITKLQKFADTKTYETLFLEHDLLKSKIDSYDDWTKRKLQLLLTKEELEKQLSRSFRKKDENRLNNEIREIIYQIKETDRKFWNLKWKKSKSIKEKEREQKLRKIFETL